MKLEWIRLSYVYIEKVQKEIKKNIRLFLIEIFNVTFCFLHILLHDFKLFYFKMFALLLAIASSRSHGVDRSLNSKVTGEDIFKTAKKKLGCKYVYGSAGPNTFDCSGLVYWAHRQNGIKIPRVSGDQAKNGKASSGKIGDVVCFGSDFHHVGICDGKGNFIHAPQTGDVVKIAPLSARHDAKRYRRYYNAWY